MPRLTSIKEIKQQLPASLKDQEYPVELVGSRRTMHPAPENSDYDVLTLGDRGLCDELVLSGFTNESEDDEYSDMPDFMSFRKDLINIIVTFDKDFYDKFLKASALCKILNLREKRDRISIFQAVLYDNYPVLL